MYAIRSYYDVVLAGADYDIPASLNVQKLAQVDLGGAFGGARGAGTGIAPSVSTVLPQAHVNGQTAPSAAGSVITSYSIHYTKLYDGEILNINRKLEGEN